MPEYDNRLTIILSTLKNINTSLNFIDPFYSIESKTSAHISNERNIEEKMKNLGYDDSFIRTSPFTKFIIFDDMITSGSTFVAYKQKILSFYPAAEIEGIFICKAIYPETE